jgi:hypothetical protein
VAEMCTLQTDKPTEPLSPIANYDRYHILNSYRDTPNHPMTLVFDFNGIGLKNYDLDNMLERGTRSRIIQRHNILTAQSLESKGVVDG